MDDKWLEIDVMEQYGEATRYHIVRHVWGKGYHTSDSTILTGALDGIADMTADFHTYGCLVTPEQIVFYFDRKEVWSTPSPPQANSPLFLLVDFAFKEPTAPNPSYMYVDYIRAWEKR